jgi:glycine cleavage system aminomethyltransferase T
VKREGGFLGAEALGVAEGSEPAAPTRRLRCLVLEDPRSVALGNEPVRIDGEITGRVTSGGYGYSVERSIAYAYVPADLGPGTRVELDIFGRWVPGEVAREPLFDPKGERVRA